MDSVLQCLGQIELGSKGTDVESTKELRLLMSLGTKIVWMVRPCSVKTLQVFHHGLFLPLWLTLHVANLC